MIKELTKEEFLNTMIEPMAQIDVYPISTSDIWGHLLDLVKKGIISDYVYDNRLIEKVYRNGAKTFDQLLLPTLHTNIYIIIIVDLTASAIFGYYQLDLNLEYGIEE